MDEVTAILASLVAPYLQGIGEVDLLLEIERPNEADARRLVALAGTASRQQYLFARADERWLQPLMAIRGYLTTPPGLIDAGDGYVQAPAWPQGEYLVRVASAAPELVAPLAARIPSSDNPRAVSVLGHASSCVQLLTCEEPLEPRLRRAGGYAANDGQHDRADHRDDPTAMRAG